jgi:flagellar hook assembly protein FlgD
VPGFDPGQTKKKLMLEQVKPHPFKTRIRLGFSLPYGNLQHAPQLRIYTGEGKEIIRIQGGLLQTSFTWDGTGADGITVEPGVYFYCIQAGDQQISGKVVKVGQ